MIDKPYYFALINIFTYSILMFVFGFKVSLPLMVCFMIFIIIYNYKKVGIEAALAMSILYSTLFDSQFFTLTALKLRVWYLIILLLFALSFIRFCFNRRFQIRNKILLSLVLFLIGLSAAHFIFDSMNGRLSSIKYWLFSIGLFYYIFKYLKPVFHENKRMFLNFLISLNIFIISFGLFQFIMWGLGKGKKVIFHYYNIRPEGFFSETTWYGTYAVFGIILILLMYSAYKSNRILFLLPLNFAGMLFSATRNSYFIIISFFVLTILLFLFMGDKIKRKKIFNRYTFILIVLILVIYFINMDLFNRYILKILIRFQMNDISATNRIDAIDDSILKIKEELLLGHGFDHNSSLESTPSGASLGSKSFNLFLMISHIFGLFGFICFFSILVLHGITILKRFAESKDIFIKYALILYVGYLLMTMIAPLHQFPLGITLVAISAIFSSQNNKNNIVIRNINL